MGGELYVDKLLAANIAVYKQPFENQKMRLMPVSGVGELPAAAAF